MDRSTQGPVPRSSSTLRVSDCSQLICAAAHNSMPRSSDTYLAGSSSLSAPTSRNVWVLMPRSQLGVRPTVRCCRADVLTRPADMLSAMSIAPHAVLMEEQLGFPTVLMNSMEYSGWTAATGLRPPGDADSPPKVVAPSKRSLIRE